MLLLIRLLIELPWETSRIPSKVFWLWKILTASTISWCWEKNLNASPVSIKWREEIRGTSGFFTEERHSNPGRGVTYGVKLALNIEKSKNKIEQCQLHQLYSFKFCPRGCSITNFRWRFSEKSLSRWLPPRPAWFSLFIGFLLTLKSTRRIRILGGVPMLWAVK